MSFYKVRNCLDKTIEVTWISRNITQSCLTLYDAVDYTVHGIPQARILEWVAVPSSSGSSQSRDWTQVSPHCRWILYQLNHQGSPRILQRIAYPFSRKSSWPRNWTGSPALQVNYLPAELPGKPLQKHGKDSFLMYFHASRILLRWRNKTFLFCRLQVGWFFRAKAVAAEQLEKAHLNVPGLCWGPIAYP